MTEAPVPSADELRRRCGENLAALETRIAAVCQRAGRGVGEVTLIGVTKYVGADLTRMLVECGCRELAESRPQQVWDKAAALADLAPRWHLVGHLQRNKVRRTLPVVSLVRLVSLLRLWWSSACLRCCCDYSISRCFCRRRGWSPVIVWM